MGGRNADLQNGFALHVVEQSIWPQNALLTVVRGRQLVVGGAEVPLIRPATAGKNACRGPPSPRWSKESKFFSRGAHAPKQQLPSPRGGTARRRGPHVLLVVGVRGLFPTLDFTPAR